MSYDVAIIGGGHNGLVCATFLAKAGQAGHRARGPRHRRRVLHHRGDGARRAGVQDEPDVDGPRRHQHPPLGGRRPRPGPLRAALDHPRPVLQLPARRRARPSPSGATTTARWRRSASSPGATPCATTASSSTMRDFWYTAAPYLQGHPKRVAPGTILELAKRLAKTRKSMGTALRILMSSPGAVIEEWFDAGRGQGGARLLFGGVDGFPRRAGLRHRPVGHGRDAPVGRPPARRRQRRLHPGPGRRAPRPPASRSAPAPPSPRSSWPGDRAVGVVTLTGETVQAGEIVGRHRPLHPDEEAGPGRRRPRDRRRRDPGDGRAPQQHLRLQGRRRPVPPAQAGPPRARRRAARQRHAASPRRSTTCAARVNATMRGELAEEIPLWISAPSVLDRTLVPPGSDGRLALRVPPGRALRAARRRRLGGREGEAPRPLPPDLRAVRPRHPGVGDRRHRHQPAGPRFASRPSTRAICSTWT